MADEVLDRLALSRAQHLKSRDNRPKSVSDEEVDAVSDWSESDRECCLLSDFESTSNVDGTNRYDIPFEEEEEEEKEEDDEDEQLNNETQIFENNLSFNNETPLPIINDSTTSTRISFSSDTEKPKPFVPEKQDAVEEKPAVQIRQQSQPSLLPARRLQTRENSLRRSTINAPIVMQTTFYSRQQKTTTASPPKLQLRRETITFSHLNQSHKESLLSPNSSFHSHDDTHHQTQQQQQQQHRYSDSPNFSQTSQAYNLVPRVYELKKLFVDDSDYGRLTDVSTRKSIPPRNRQKWGTIVHPPFPLGYQQVSSEHLTQVVERLTSPARCRDRHTPTQTPSKRYLSVEETDALINRLTKVKPLRSPEQYWSVQRPSRAVKSLSNSLKTSSSWKGVGISA